MDLALAVFVAVYAVMIAGRVPGLSLDRTAGALLGSIVLVAGGSLSSGDAWRAIDVGTIALLLGLMVVSAQFRLAGSYAAITRWLAARPTSPERLLAELIATAGGLAALLTNDVVCLAMAPVLVDVCVRRGLDPVPFLLGLAAAANVGSAATLIGNPQNMLIGQSLHLSFGRYLIDGSVPAVAGLAVAWWILARAYRGRFARTMPLVHVDDRAFDRRGTAKGTVVLTLLVFGLLACPLPRDVQAMLAAAAVLVSRRTSARELLDGVDWQLLVLFAGLFVCNHAFQSAGHAAAAFGWLGRHGVDLGCPTGLFAAMAVLQSPLVGSFEKVLPLTFAGCLAAALAELAGGGRVRYAVAGTVAFLGVMGATVLAQPFALMSLMLCAYGMATLGMDGEMRKSGGFGDD